MSRASSSTSTFPEMPRAPTAAFGGHPDGQKIFNARAFQKKATSSPSMLYRGTTRVRHVHGRIWGRQELQRHSQSRAGQVAQKPAATAQRCHCHAGSTKYKPKYGVTERWDQLQDFVDVPTGPCVRKTQIRLNTSNGAKLITISKLFRRLKILFLFTLSEVATLQLSQARSAPNIAIPSLKQRPAWQGKRTQRCFLLVGQVPWYSCAVESVLRNSCPVTRPPSCQRLHRQAVKPLPPLQLCRLFVHVSVWLEMVTSCSLAGFPPP